MTQRKSFQTSIEDIRRVHGRILGGIINRLQSHTDKYKYNYYYSENNGKNLKIQIPGFSSHNS